MKKYIVTYRQVVEEDPDGTVAGYEDIEEFLIECRPQYDDFDVTVVDD